MKVAFDASFLVFLLNPRSNASVERASDRVDGLIKKLSNKHDKVIIPTPALAEILVSLRASGPKYLEEIKKYSCFQIRAFDERAAIEFSVAVGQRSKTQQQKTRKTIVQSKIKFDQQIVAIAKVHGAKVVYSDDKTLRKFAEECGIEAFGLADISHTTNPGKIRFERR